MWVWTLVMTAQAREVVAWETPAWPDETVACTASVDVAEDGAVSLRSLKGCKEHEALVSGTVARWRYVPASESSVERIELAHSPALPKRLLAQSAIDWPTPELAAEAASCFARVTLEADGSIAGVEASGCSAEARGVFEAGVRSWRFGPGEVETLWLSSTLQPNQPEPTRRIQPTYPSGAEGSARCTAQVVVGADGKPQEVSVDDCDEPFAAAAQKAVEGWRWPRSEAAWSKPIGVTYEKL